MKNICKIINKMSFYKRKKTILDNVLFKNTYIFGKTLTKKRK